MGRVANDDKLNEKILADLKADVSWKEIREKHNVANNYISSVCGIYRTEIDASRKESSYYKGSRVNDGQGVSPVKTFKLNEMTEEELEERGLLKYKKTK